MNGCNSQFFPMMGFAGTGNFHSPSDCPNLADGNYAMSACGNQFLTCSHGTPYVVNCSATLVYNWNTNQCDWPQNLNCTNQGNNSSGGETISRK